MLMKNPSHPGEIIRWGILEPLDLTTAKAAEILGVRRAALSAVINGKTALSPDLALRVEKAFGPTVDLLLRIQAAYDAAQVRKRAKRTKVRRYVTKTA
jgi:addiction module HigA family antidote